MYLWTDLQVFMPPCALLVLYWFLRQEHSAFILSIVLVFKCVPLVTVAFCNANWLGPWTSHYYKLPSKAKRLIVCFTVKWAMSVKSLKLAVFRQKSKSKHIIILCNNNKCDNYPPGCWNHLFTVREQGLMSGKIISLKTHKCSWSSNPG